MSDFDTLKREQIEKILNKVASFSQEPLPKRGWIQTIRNALGISSRTLAGKLGCTNANIIALEQREAKGTITLETLQKVAQSMNCKLVYYFVPIESLDKILEDQARLIARKRVELVNHSMQLEQQGLTPAQLKQQEEALVKELLQGDVKKLWNDI